MQLSDAEKRRDEVLEMNKKEAQDKEDNRMLFNGQKAVLFNNKRFTDCYLMKNYLGSGAHSTVFKCQSKLTGDNWAVKIFEKKLLNADDPDKYTREISILKKLEHPNIISIYEYLEDEERVYLLTPICKGGELFCELNNRRKVKKRWTEKQVARIIHQVLSAVCYCHAQGIAHRDIKAENILFVNKETLEIRLIDFGSAKYLPK